MIWFWTREHQRMRLETRYDNDTSEFVVVIQRDDGREESERFSDIAAFRQRLVALEQQCEAEQCVQSGAPVLLPEGFPNQPLALETTGKTLAAFARACDRIDTWLMSNP